MPPLFPSHSHTLLAIRRSSAGTVGSEPPTMSDRVVFALCIVFGSLLGCVLAVVAVYFARRRRYKKRNTTTLALRREASFQAGAPSVIDIIAPPRPARRPSTRMTSPLPRISIPSPELGSIFGFDAVSNLMRRGSSRTPTRTSAQRLSAGSVEGLASTPTPAPKASSPRYESLLSTGSTLVATPVLFDKYDMPLRVMNPSPLMPSNTIAPPLQKPNPVYRAGSTPSRERLVTSSASAESLFSGSTGTPPLSPPSTWSQPGTHTVNSPTEVVSPTSVAIHKPPSQQSMSTVASSPHIAVECYEMSPYLVGLEQAPYAPPRRQGPLSSSPPPDRSRSAEEVAFGALGTPLTLSHFPFRFSSSGPSSPGMSSLSSMVYGSPVPSSNLGTHSPPVGRQSLLSVPNAQGYGLGFLNTGSSWSLPAHSTPSLKLKIRHIASDEIIAIAFAPQSINFQVVCDAVRGRLDFEPRRVWSNESADGASKRVDIVDDASLWSWLDEQYTKGHTRLILQVE